MDTDTRPSNAEELENYARRKWTEQCQNYLKGKSVHLLPVELKPIDRAALNNWWNDYKPDSLKDEEIEKWLLLGDSSTETLRLEISNKVLKQYIRDELTKAENAKELYEQTEWILTEEDRTKLKDFLNTIGKDKIDNYYLKREKDESQSIVDWIRSSQNE